MESGDPLIFVLNHPSWWDLITAFVLSNNVPDYRHFAPIESAMLEKYGIFKGYSYEQKSQLIQHLLAKLEVFKPSVRDPNVA